ncbi:probable WRKY transcription factor 50 [Prosopis cineraria]|uniref:probable WRKY transcription factor 50 n=1 Tax=Prosopis cineraria TaxID=364024 RepID=UPI00240F20A4|nr:probable WRKY transcription factor 50 [Prosopis cineraria]
MDYYFGSPIAPSPNYSQFSAPANSSSSDQFISDYLVLDNGFGHQESWSRSTESSEKATSDASGFSGAADATSSKNNNIKCKNNIEGNKREMNRRIAFRTRSELEIMDDGYKWRKYGKKSVKNSPNPRNYYKCSYGGCGVKKRVERDREDSSYVITSYEGVHNHETPCATYYSSFVHHPNPLPFHSANSSSS